MIGAYAFKPDPVMAETIKLSLIWDLVRRNFVKVHEIPALVAAAPDTVLDRAFLHCGMIRATGGDGLVVEILPRTAVH